MNAHAATARADRTRPVHVGDHLREWRQRRHLSQLDLAGDAEISARHLSFVETGRAAPSRDMVLKLAERLDVPLRERNVLLVAAGFAPAFPQRSLDDPALKSARAAIDLVLKAHEPNPALAYDRHWNLVSANRMVAPLLEGVPARLLGQPFNILRLAFHPEALAPRTVNLAEWCGHLLERLHRQCEATADPELIKLYEELKAYPIPARSAPLSARQRRDPLQAAARRRGAELHLHHHGVRHAGRHHAVGTGAGDVLSGRRADRRADAGDGGRRSNSCLARARIAAYLWGFPERGRAHEHPEAASDRHRLRRGVPVVLYRQAPDRERAGAGAGRAGRGALAAVLPQSLGAARGHQPRRISHHEVRLGRGLQGHRRARRRGGQRRGARLPARAGQAPAQHHRLPPADPLGRRARASPPR